MEEAEAPFRCRLQRDGLKFSRDISKWEARTPVFRRGEKRSEEEGDEFAGENERACGGNIRGERGTGGDGANLFAFPLVVHNSHAHHVVSTARKMVLAKPKKWLGSQR